jgi:hypothetical protein
VLPASLTVRLATFLSMATLPWVVPYAGRVVPDGWVRRSPLQARTGAAKALLASGCACACAGLPKRALATPSAQPGWNHWAESAAGVRPATPDPTGLSG